MSKEENAIVEWIESGEGYYHACAFTENALIMGFPQKKRQIWPTFGALIIKREPVGIEPEVVALFHEGDTFRVVKRYDLDDTESDVYDWAYQTLMVSLPRIVREWAEWSPFIGGLFQEALIKNAEAGMTMFHKTSNEDIEA